MKKYFRFIISAAVLVGIFSVSAFALTENEVQEEVSRIGREGVTGNIFVWFLCAVAFLKVSQKIDSFMSSLGINVGHTGGSMLAEVLISAKSIGSTLGAAVRVSRQENPIVHRSIPPHLKAGFRVWSAEV